MTSLWKLWCRFFQRIIFVNIENDLINLNFLSLFTSEWKSFFYWLVTCTPTFLNCRFSQNIPWEKLFQELSIQTDKTKCMQNSFIKVCEMVWGHLMPHFLTQRECKSKPEILIQFTQNQNAHKNIIFWVLWVFFFLFSVKSELRFI